MGFGFSSARDLIARGLIRAGVSPNALTLTGMAMTVAAGVCYAAGSQSRFGWSLSPSAEANSYLLLAGVLLVLASACDMLDGAVARLGGKSTRFGAFLDSTFDRCSDFAIYAGIAVCYAWRQPANVTFILLAMFSFFNAFMISYTRARAEDIIDHCRVGYWQRGERCAAILFATFAYNIPALLVQQGILPAFTVWRRLSYAKRVIEGRATITDPRKGGFWLKIQPWRWPRMTLPYDVITSGNILWLVLAPMPAVDIIRNWLGG